MSGEKPGQLLGRDLVAGGVPVRVIRKIDGTSGGSGVFESRRQVQEGDPGAGTELTKELVLRETVGVNVSDAQLHVIVTTDEIDRPLEFFPA